MIWWSFSLKRREPAKNKYEPGLHDRYGLKNVDVVDKTFRYFEDNEFTCDLVLVESV